MITLSNQCTGLPQDEILARLLFGESVAQLTPLQIASIGAALVTITGVGGGGFNPLNTVQHALGLNRLVVSGGPSNTATQHYDNALNPAHGDGPSKRDATFHEPRLYWCEAKHQRPDAGSSAGGFDPSIEVADHAEYGRRHRAGRDATERSGQQHRRDLSIRVLMSRSNASYSSAAT